MTTEAELQQAQNDLRRLSRMLGEFEIAKDLIDTYGFEVVGQAVSMVEANSTDEEDDGDKLSLVAQALKNTPNARTKPDIVLGKNRTKVCFGGAPKKDTSTASFNNAASKVAKISASMSEDHIEDRRSANGELPWKKRNVSSSMMRTVKAAALKSRAQRLASESASAFNVNEQAMAILRARALKEDNNTVAAQTIRAHGLPREDSIRPQLPPEFSDSGLIPAQRERSVSSMLPAEFASAKKSTVADEYLSAAAKIKAGHVRSLSDAGKTLNRPKPVFDNKEADFEELPQPTTIKDSGKISRSPEGQAKTRQPTEFDVDLAKPKKPGQYGDQLYTGQI